MARFRLYNPQNKLVGSEHARSLTFVETRNVSVTRPSSTQFMSDVLTGLDDKIVFIKSPEPCGFGYQGGMRLFGSFERANYGVESFVAQLYVFSRPTTTVVANQPRVRVFQDVTGLVTFNSADLRAKIAGVFNQNVAAAGLRGSSDYGNRPEFLYQSLNTGLPAGNYALHVSPVPKYIYAVFQVGPPPQTRLERFVPIFRLSGTTIQTYLAEDARNFFGGSYWFTGYNEGFARSLIFTVLNLDTL